METLRNTEKQFSEVEENIILTFAKEMEAERVDRSVNSVGNERLNLFIGLTEIEVQKNSTNNTTVTALNTTPGSHYLGNELTNPAELVKELELIKLRIK